MPVRLFGVTMRATPTARGSTSHGPRERPPEDRIASPLGVEQARALRSYRNEAIALLADDEARRAGQQGMSSVERRNARRRRDRSVAPLRATPEGRELVAAEASAIEGARVAAKMIARAVAEYQAVIASAIDAYGEAVAEYGFASSTARRFALQHAIFGVAAYQLLNGAFADGPAVQTMTNTGKTPSGSRAVARLAGFRDLAGLAAAFVTKSQIALETAWRAEDRFRQEERARRIDAERRAWTASAAVAPELPEHDDERERGDGRIAPTRPEPCDDDEHEAEDEAAIVASVEEEASPARAVNGAWCPIRGRLVPEHMANRPRPCASDGPDWPRRMAEEDQEIRRFDEERLREARRLK